MNLARRRHPFWSSVSLAFAMAGWLTVAGSPTTGITAQLNINRTAFGRTPDGAQVELYTLTNGNGLEAKVMNYGATLIAVKVPDRHGTLDNVTLHLDTLAEYLAGHPLFGSIVGRYANRIAGAEFNLDGSSYPLTANAGAHHIHGGRIGFQKVVWDARMVQDQQSVAVQLDHVSPDGHEGYPGRLTVRTVYRLTNDNELVMEYMASTDKPTHVNLTNHAYWNLGGAGSGDVMGHVLLLCADRYLPSDAKKIPLGQQASVKGTAMDFTKPQTIGSRIDQVPGGYDHCYVLNRKRGDALSLAARVVEPITGRVMEVHTTQPGVQLYTANGLRRRRKRDGVLYGPHHGLCLETQHFPDSPNHPRFPSTVLRPGQTYHQVTRHKFSVQGAQSAPWPRHTIDNTSQGADGVRLADVNGDARLDIVTGWEEGGVIRVYINPGPVNSTQPWPAVTVGRAPWPEDAVLVDLDGDGAKDVVSSCEGNTQTIFCHWAPNDAGQYLAASDWRTQPVPCTVQATRWMFALPMQVDGLYGRDLIVGSKSPQAMIGWLQAPRDARDLADWRLHPLYRAGWIMSLIPIDVDQDGDLDVLVSDRYGRGSGVLWLENPGPELVGGPWPEHRLGLSGQQVMFVDTCDVNGDGRVDVAAAVKARRIAILLQPKESASPWVEHHVEFSPSRWGTSKAVRVADLSLDGRLDMVVTCEGAGGPRSGLFWMSYRDSILAADWDLHDIGGPEGTKYDLFELLDLDDDGDLDVVTCEEADNLGVIWYENPVR